VSEILRFIEGKFRLGEKELDLAEAVKSRNAASFAVEKILKRRLQEFYKAPSLSGFPPFLNRLDTHQVVGLQWILKRKRSYLAHAPGAGKTCQAILAAVLAEGPGQNVFIVPPSLVENWKREILKVTEWVDLWPSIGVVGGSNDQERVAWNADFLIVPDSMLAKDWVYERLRKIRIKVLAVDEASRFKEPTAQRSLALYGGRSGDVSYPGLYQSARHVVFLDGSPMPNRPLELFAPTFALDPESIGCMGMDDFGMRYCGARPNERGVWEYKFSSNEKELHQKLTKSFMHVVTEAELSHPERRRSMLFMTDVRSRKQKTWERKNLGSLELTESASQGELARFRKELGLRKVPWIAAYVHDRLVEKKESVLLFAWHREVVLELEACLGPGVVMGGTPAKERERLFEEFQSGKRKLLIMNIAAGGRGHNLQRADRVIFGEFSWSDETNKQCEHRAARRGNEKEFVRSDYIVCPNSMDERVLSSVFTKEKRVREVIG